MKFVSRDDENTFRLRVGDIKHPQQASGTRPTGGHPRSIAPRVNFAMARQDFLNLRFRDVMLVDVRLVRLWIDVVTDLHGASVIKRPLTPALTGGPSNARTVRVQRVVRRHD